MRFPFVRTGLPDHPAWDEGENGAEKSLKIITSKMVRAFLREFEGLGLG